MVGFVECPTAVFAGMLRIGVKQQLIKNLPFGMPSPAGRAEDHLVCGLA